MLSIFCFNIFPKNLIPEDVQAQVLQGPVGGSHADQGWKSSPCGRLWTLGVKPHPIILHTRVLDQRQQFPRGGVVGQIYLRIDYFNTIFDKFHSLGKSMQAWIVYHLIVTRFARYRPKHASFVY